MAKLLHRRSQLYVCVAANSLPSIVCARRLPPAPYLNLLLPLDNIDGDLLISDLLLLLGLLQLVSQLRLGPLSKWKHKYYNCVQLDELTTIIKISCHCIHNSR